MKQLSIGADSTLGVYKKMCTLFFGTDSPATKYIEDAIAASPNGENEEVIAAESQMLFLLGSLHTGVEI